MREFYNGMFYDVQGIQFDLVGQCYSIWIKQHKFLEFWRRENNKLGIEVKDVWIYISPNTPHIAKLISDGKNTEEICSEIGINLLSYIDYACNNKNRNWVNFTTGDPIMLEDRVEMIDAINKVGIKEEDRGKIKTFKAY